MADNTETVAAVPTTATTAAPVSVASPASLGYVLVVCHAFGDYQRGAEITDAATINEILSGETACYVIKRAA